MFVPHRPTRGGELAAFGIWLVLTGLAKTWRVKIEDRSGIIEGRIPAPVIFCIWHNRLGLSMTFLQIFRRAGVAKGGLAALISASKDGAILARALERFRVRAIRGSSSRRGGQSLLELSRALEDGMNIAITPDGPRGPKYRLHDGILALAQLSQRPIVPVGAYVRRKTCLKSWDQFQLPHPFAKCELIVGEPMMIPADGDEGMFAEKKEELVKVMMALNRD